MGREQLPNDVCITEFNCLGCGAPLTSKPWLPSGLARHQRITCIYCGSEYLLPGPEEILYTQELGNYTYLGMSNGDVYVSQDDGETWSLRHTFPRHIHPADMPSGV
jgi:DNA-directed RNA polymerase subunit RPC12/RpoP